MPESDDLAFAIARLASRHNHRAAESADFSDPAAVRFTIAFNR